MTSDLRIISYPYMRHPLHTGVLPSGLRVYLWPREDFQEVCATFTVQVGGKDLSLEKKSLDSLPAGLAHFVEHSIFSLPDGRDAMQVFSELGASSNAYTSLHQTSYFFSSTQDLTRTLQLLLEMVNEFQVSDTTIAKEKDIIIQEIKMYQDTPDDQLYTGILASLYPNTSLALDIAGTVEGVDKIDQAILQGFYKSYYQVSNSFLFLSGHMKVEDVWQQLVNLDKHVDNSVKCFEKNSVSLYPILPNRTISMDVACPKMAVGVRGREMLVTNDILVCRVALSLFFGLLLGWTSSAYQALYKDGKIDSSFTLHVEVQEDYHFFVVTVDTEEPIAVSTFLQKVLKEATSQADLNDEHLNLLKREMYGDFIRNLNSMDGVVSQFAADYTGVQTMFDIPLVLQDLDLEKVVTVGRDFLNNCDMTDFIIFPQ